MGYVVRATWTVQEGHEDTVLANVRALTPLSRAEPGCQFYQAYRDPEAPEVIHLFEIYDDEAAYQAHGSSAHFQDLGFDKSIPLLANRERWFFQTIDAD
jgi:quinol monooxygenase YgiN